MRLLVTGATGFVGRAVLAQASLEQGLLVRGAVRGQFTQNQKNVEIVQVGDLSPDSNWTQAVRGVDVIVHAAARVHVMCESAEDPLVEFRQVNVLGTLNLARQAAREGVKRFIFISSIKVNGEQTQLGHSYTADDAVAPTDPYGISKYEAEQGLLQFGRKSGMEVVVIRPVLVYGPGVKANFLSMMNWLQRGIPLPLGAINNKRSLVAIDNLVSLIMVCLQHPAAANQIFLVSDGEDLSTPDLLRRMGFEMGKKVWLLPVPQALIELVAAVLGKRSLSQRLCSSLQVDISKTRKLLNWTPPVSVTQALAKTAQHYLKRPEW